MHAQLHMYSTCLLYTHTVQYIYIYMYMYSMYMYILVKKKSSFRETTFIMYLQYLLYMYVYNEFVQKFMMQSLV